MCIYRTVSKEEARAITIDCVQEFCAVVNSNQALKSHLDGLVFTDKNIRFTVFVVDAQGNDIYHPDIFLFGSREGKLAYHTRVPDSYSAKTRESETFQEALTIVQEKDKAIVTNEI